MAGRAIFLHVASIVVALATSSFVSIDSLFAAQHGVQDCVLRSYSVEVMETKEVAAGKWGLDYVERTQKKVLALLSTGGEPTLANTKPADISLIYVMDSEPHRRFSYYRQSAADLLATLPRPSPEARILVSPWLQLSLEPDCKLRAILIWNIRQMIADQANLYSVRPVATGMVTHGNDPKARLLIEFEQEVVNLSDDVKYGERPTRTETDRLQQKVIRRIKDRFPPDLLWYYMLTGYRRLFDSSFTSIIHRQDRELKSEGSKHQADLILALAADFLTQRENHRAYTSILEAGELLDLDEYKIKLFQKARNR